MPKNEHLSQAPANQTALLETEVTDERGPLLPWRTASGLALSLAAASALLLAFRPGEARKLNRR